MRLRYVPALPTRHRAWKGMNCGSTGQRNAVRYAGLRNAAASASAGKYQGWGSWWQATKNDDLPHQHIYSWFRSTVVKKYFNSSAAVSGASEPWIAFRSMLSA